MPHLTISRTIYDPATKDFVFDSAESKALPNIRQWINKKNPVIYWYVLRVDNQSELQLDQWAIELYTHQALNITDAYIDGIDRRFELKKREHDSWSDKYVLSIPKQLGIPIVGKGTRRVFFKVDINCKEGLMHEYGISGRFISSGVETVDIKEKFFQYSCKVGEFRQIFNNNPDEASVYAEKRLSTRYSDNDVHLFTNSFRMIYDLYRYCHSGSIKKEELMNKLQLLYANFEKVPDIAKEKINPLLYDGIRELELIRNIDTFKSRYIRLCDSLVELLHIEVMGANPGKGAIAAQENETPSQGTDSVNGDENISRQDGHTAGTGNRECPVCKNIIDSSNKSLLCKKCGSRFCQTCESWFRVEIRKPGERPLCEMCYTKQQGLLARKRIEIIEEDFEDKEGIELIVVETADVEPADEISADEFTEFIDEIRFESQSEEEKLQKEREKQELLRKAQKEKERIHLQQEELERRRKEEERKAQEAARLKAAEEAEKKGQEEERLGREREEAAKKPASLIKNSIGMEFLLISVGEFQMGSDNRWCFHDKPVHKVKISKPFYLGKYPVTQKEWGAVMGTNPSCFKGDNNPVEKVSWNDVQKFVKKLNEKEGTDKYRLPSEAEWEYACRAGTTTKYSFGDNESKLGEYAWYDDNSGGKTHPVGQKKSNPWRLHDMHGNVCEWCQDRLHDSYEGAPTDGSSWEDGSSFPRLIRGGSWAVGASWCKSACRNSFVPVDRYRCIGFRLVKEV